MIGYITLGTNDLPRAVAYYDELMKLLGAGRFLEDESFVAWSQSAESPGFSVTKPFDGKKATVGNGVMIALNVENKEQVHALYNKAIELGGTDEGKPGLRSDDGFYCGYFRDLDGNKLNVFCMAGK
ncbi:Lactoylglutathione lyase and related lyases [hydrothermal vent metagenome]|uniref:Lactoylglutathione lyase and related lyases n=2 Tax=hydrothermal vent metagenome TaxID=652676 RepID=A0A3B0VSJ5_9ZZZZ